MIHGMQEQRETNGTFALRTIHEGRGPASLVVRGLRGDDDRTAAKHLIELADAARDAGKVDERGGVWVIRARGVEVPIAVERVPQPGLFGFLKPPSELVLRDVGVADRSPMAAMASALTIEGMSQVRTAPLVARQTLEQSIRLSPGDPGVPDDLEARDSNHQNHLAYLGLSMVAEEEGDWERATSMLRDGLRRSWAAQMRVVGGRLQKIQRTVPRRGVMETLGVLTRGPLVLYDRTRKSSGARRGVVLVPSPVHTFGAQGRAVLQMIEVPKRWARLFYEGVGRRAAEDEATVELAADAIEAHMHDVVPLVLVTRSYPLFDPLRRAEGVALPVEYFPPFQLWSSVIASIAAWTTAGLTRDEIRAMLSLERDRAARDAGAAKWRAFGAKLGRDREALEGSGA
jgi:hypothetical protein